MAKLADALEGSHSGWRGVPYVRIDGDTDSRERLEVLLRDERQAVSAMPMPV